MKTFQLLAVFLGTWIVSWSLVFYSTYAIGIHNRSDAVAVTFGMVTLAVAVITTICFLIEKKDEL